MDIISLIPKLWKIVDKTACAVNISNNNDEVTINIIDRKNQKKFTSRDYNTLICKLKKEYAFLA